MITMGTTRHQQVVAGVAWLVEMDFTAGTQYLTTAAQSLTTGGHTYTGLGALVSVAGLNESADSSAEKITLSLAAANAAMLVLGLGNVEGYRGRAVRLYLQLFDETFTAVASPLQRWSGVMDKVQITRQPADPAGGPGGGSIDLQCSLRRHGPRAALPGPAPHPPAAAGALCGRHRPAVRAHAGRAAGAVAVQTVPAAMSPGIPALLTAYLGSLDGAQPFDWAAHNCAHFAGHWWLQATGNDALLGLPMPATAEAAGPWLAQQGGSLAGLGGLRRARPRSDPRRAQSGDVVIIGRGYAPSFGAVGIGAALGICTGRLAAMMSPEGRVVFGPMVGASAAFALRTAP